jgi:hypothetical protein
MAISADQVSSEIQSTMALARSEAITAVNAAMTLVSSAVGVLNQYTPEYPEETITISDSGYSAGSGFNAEDKPPTFPSIRTPQQIIMGELGDLDTIDETFNEEAPTLDIPAFEYETPESISPFTKDAPEIDSNVTIPTAPTFDYPDLPTLLTLNTDISLDQLTIPEHNFTEPSYSNLLSDDFISALARGNSALPNYDNYGMQLVDRFFPGYSTSIQGLYNRISGILDGSQTALTEAHDSSYYDTMRNRISLEYDKAEQALDEATLSTGFALPGLARAAGIKRIQQENLQALNQAALEVYVKRSDREVQHLQFVMNIIPPLQQSVIALFGQAWSMQMDGFRGALEFADVSTKFALAVYGLKQRDFELMQGLVERQIAIFEALLKAELAKADITRVQLEVEKLKSEINHDLISQYTAQLGGQETKARVYASEISALQQTIAARKIPLEVFLAEIQSFSALSDAKKSEYALIEAKISGDRAKTEGQLGKLQVYKTKADVFGTKVSAKGNKIEAQAKRNQQILEEFKARVQAEVQYSQIDGEISKNALDAYKAQSSIFLAETEANLNEAKFAFQKALEDAKLKLEQTRFSFERQFKALEIEMTRVKATSDINLAGAEVQGRIGAASMSVLNSMVSLDASVSA